jgi:hypothetical protein
MALFNAFVLVKNDLIASYTFFVSDAILLLLASLACIFAFWRMKELNFIRNDVHAHKSAQFLDRLLLIVGKFFCQMTAAHMYSTDWKL